jgi:hypothetical protein
VLSAAAAGAAAVAAAAAAVVDFGEEAVADFAGVRE